MQFLYRLGAVVFGTATFLGTMLVGFVVYALFYEPPWGVPLLLVIPVSLGAAWGAVRVWRWVCGQDMPRRASPHPRRRILRAPEEVREPRLFPERPIKVIEWTDHPS